MIQYCSRCGTKINNKNNFCTQCGNSTTAIQQPAPVVAKKEPANSWSVIGLIFSFMISELGIIFCIAGLLRAKKNDKAGRIISYIGIAISFIRLILEYSWLLKV